MTQDLIDDKSALVQIAGFMWSANKSLHEPMLPQIYFAIYGITKPQWVNVCYCAHMIDTS